MDNRMWRKTKRKYTEIEKSKRWDETEQNERTVSWTMRVKMWSNDLINIIVYIPSILFVLTLYICMHLFVYVWKEVIESKWDWLFTTGYSSQRRRIVNSCHKRNPNKNSYICEALPKHKTLWNLQSRCNLWSPLYKLQGLARFPSLICFSLSFNLTRPLFFKTQPIFVM